MGARTGLPAGPGAPVASAGAVARDGERGAVLVHVAVAFAGLLAFSALTIDLGVLWIARAEAQNAADAAALAGAVSLAYVDPSDTAMALDAAKATVAANQVWGEALGVPQIQSSVGPCPSGSPSAGGDCVGIRVSRGGQAGLPLPTFFASLFGLSAQEVHASASAKVTVGNSSTCMRPWAVADRWSDLRDTPNDGVWTPDDVFERYQPGGQLLPGVVDEYAPPTTSSAGTGQTFTALNGRRLFLGRENLDFPDVRGDLFYSLDLRRVGPEPGGRDQYIMNVTSCSGVSVSIGETVNTGYAHTQDTIDAVALLVQQDPGAVWNDATGMVTGSAFAVSPRIVPIALYDPDELARLGDPPTTTFPLRVRNIVGFFVERYDGILRGVVVPMPGMLDESATTMADEAAFLRTVALVR